MTASRLWGIVGGGFGLYGYLPALVKSGVRCVLVEERHRTVVEQRPELFPYRRSVKWVSAGEDVLSRAESLVLAVPPAAQAQLVRALPTRTRYDNLVLEKPVAVHPEEAREVFERALTSSKSIRIGYSFLSATWGSDWKKSLGTRGEWALKWEFLAHHFASRNKSWKVQHRDGGGALRFYGIHIVALLASTGNWKVAESRLVSEDGAPSSRWQAKFSLGDLVSFSVDLDSHSRSLRRFSLALVTPQQEMIIDAETPFSGIESATDDDVRVRVLQDLIATFAQPDAEFYNTYARVDDLWSRIERVTEQEPPNTEF